MSSFKRVDNPCLDRFPCVAHAELILLNLLLHNCFWHFALRRKPIKSGKPKIERVGVRRVELVCFCLWMCDLESELVLRWLDQIAFEAVVVQIDDVDSDIRCDRRVKVQKSLDGYNSMLAKKFKFYLINGTRDNDKIG